MKQETLTCILCPNGCELNIRTAEGASDGECLTVTGARCRRGEAYALQELTAPRRTLTSSVRVTGGELPLASVRLTGPIPKERMADAMACIRAVRLAAPVRMGQMITANLLGLGVDLIATREVAAQTTAP